MTFAIHDGVWPVMITPWTENNTPDFKAIEALTNWYVEKGCDGIFAVCQSSEMHFLSAQEKLDIARCVTETVAGRIQDDEIRFLSNVVQHLQHIPRQKLTIA